MAAPRNPYMNPLDVYRAVYEARAKGPVNDPYNLNAAVLRTGAGYGLLADQVRSAAVAEGLSNRETAQQQAGYYPAAAGYSTALYNTGIEEQQQKLAAIKDIEAAWQAAKAALPNETPGSDAYNEYMLSHMNTRAGAEKIKPDVIAGYQRQQVQSLQKQTAKAVIDEQIRQKFIKQYIAEKKAAYMQDAERNGYTPEQGQEMFLAEAERLADEKAQQLNVQPDIDPRTGEITLYDPQGRPVPLNPDTKAQIQAMAGQFGSPEKIMDKLRQARDAQIRRDWLTGSGSSSSGTPPVDPTKLRAQIAKEEKAKLYDPKKDPIYTALDKHFTAVSHAYYAALAKPDLDPGQLKELKKQFDKVEQALNNYSRQRAGQATGGSLDQASSLMTGGGAANSGAESTPGVTPDWAIPGYQDMGTPMPATASAAPATPAASDMGIPTAMGPPTPYGYQPYSGPWDKLIKYLLPQLQQQALTQQEAPRIPAGLYGE